VFDGPVHHADDVRGRVLVLEAGAGLGTRPVPRDPRLLPALAALGGAGGGDAGQRHRGGRRPGRDGRGDQPVPAPADPLDRRPGRHGDPGSAGVRLLHPDPQSVPLAGAGAARLHRRSDPRQAGRCGRAARHPGPARRVQPAVPHPGRGRHRHDALGLPLHLAIQPGGGGGNRPGPHAPGNASAPPTRSFAAADGTSSSA